MAKISAYDHTSFTVTDLDAAVTFWRDAMDFRVDDVSPRTQPWLGAVVGVPGAHCRIAHLVGHGLHLEFIAYDGPYQGENVFGPANCSGAAHVSFLVEDIHPLVERLLKHGAKQIGPITFCDSGRASGCDAVYLTDPNGVIVELVAPGEKCGPSEDVHPSSG